MFPLSVEPDWLTWLDTITSISLGMVDGGCELFPGSLVQVVPQVRAPPKSTYPFMEAGPLLTPLKVLSFHHCAPQKSAAFPMVGFPADTSPITKAPTEGGDARVALDEALAGS